MFFPVLGVLFAFFILSLFTSQLLPGRDQLWIRASLNLLIAVLFNTLPETIYFDRGGIAETFGTSLEFIKDNFIEWFAPAVIILLPLVLIGYADLSQMWLLIGLMNPLQLMEYVLLRLSSPYMMLVFGAQVFVMLLLMYFVFIFRGFLYKELHGSGRRKRLYQYKFK